MEFKNVVFNAARDGKLRRLKLFLDHRSRSEVSLLVQARTNGATPLVMAAKNGHLNCVEYLVERCSADLEQVGSVVFDGETIDGAPPLWCAAAAGHLEVVSYVLQHDANVNATTKTNSTPLRAACFDGHFEIVKYLVEHSADIEVANRHGHTCLMIACYKGHYEIARYLIEIEADVNRKSVKGNTALHDCAESGSLDIMKLLLDHKARMDVDSYGMTPLLAASVTGHTHIAEYLISRTDLVSPKDKIDALELLGATYVDKKRDMLGALKFWKMAMKERYYILIRDEDIQNAIRGMDQNSTAGPDGIPAKFLIESKENIAVPLGIIMRKSIDQGKIPDILKLAYVTPIHKGVPQDEDIKRCIGAWMSLMLSVVHPFAPMTSSSILFFGKFLHFDLMNTKQKKKKV
ncbi:unnamed protein product, partial [Meganyctiphanes norvegica]